MEKSVTKRNYVHLQCDIKAELLHLTLPENAYLHTLLTPQLEKMTIPTLPLTLAEKSSIVQRIYAVILADGNVHPNEINAFRKLMYVFDFDSNFIQQANILSAEQGNSILTAMPSEKKKLLSEILDDVAKSDGYVHQKETALITRIFSAIAS